MIVRGPCDPSGAANLGSKILLESRKTASVRSFRHFRNQSIEQLTFTIPKHCVARCGKTVGSIYAHLTETYDDYSRHTITRLKMVLGFKQIMKYFMHSSSSSELPLTLSDVCSYTGYMNAKAAC